MILRRILGLYDLYEECAEEAGWFLFVNVGRNTREI